MILSRTKRKFIICFLTLIVLLIIYLVPEDNNYDDITINYIKPNSNIVYLLNDNLLVRTRVVSNEEDINKKVIEILESLIIDGSKKDYIDKNYKAVIPKNTKILSIDLKDKLLKINFSKEFLNVNEQDENKVIESIIYSLTELDEVSNIMIFVEDVKLDKLPISKKTLHNILNRDYGINKVYNINKLDNVTKATIYYFTNINNETNLVPVTIFSNDDINKVEIIIEELKAAPIYQSNLMSFLSDNAKVLDYELKENSVKLDFSNYLLDNFFQDSLLEEVKYAISLSLKDSLGLENVEFFVNNAKI